MTPSNINQRRFPPQNGTSFKLAKYDSATVGMMYAFLRAAICDCAPEIEVHEGLNWDALRKLSAEQGVLSWVWDGICKLPEDQLPPRFIRIGWDLSAQQVWDRYQRQKDVLKELIEICRTHDMRLMLLKGISLSHLYPKPQSRPSGDIDIYLFEDFKKGNKVFSLDESTDTGLHTEFIYKGVHVENHEMIVYPNTSTKKLVSQYLAERAGLAAMSSDGYWVLETKDNLVYLMMHALNHVNFSYNVSFLNIKNLTDIAMMIAHYQEEWNPEEMFSLMGKLHLAKSFELMVYFSEWLFGIDLPKLHQGLIKERNVAIIQDLFMTKCLYVPISEDTSFIKRICLCVTRYRLLRRLYQYMPQHKKSFLMSSIRQAISNNPLVTE